MLKTTLKLSSALLLGFLSLTAVIATVPEDEKVYDMELITQKFVEIEQLKMPMEDLIQILGISLEFDTPLLEALYYSFLNRDEAIEFLWYFRTKRTTDGNWDRPIPGIELAKMSSIQAISTRAINYHKVLENSLNLCNMELTVLPRIISYLTHLNTLNLTKNQLTNITALAPLKNLNFLFLSENKINDISSLRSLTNLTFLNLSDNPLTSVTTLAAMTKLTFLCLYNTQLTNVTDLDSLKNLTELNISHNNISDVTALGALRKLSILHLSENQLTNVTALGTLRNLTELSLSENNISDVRDLAAMRNLNKLFLSKNQITDLSALGSLRKLTELYAYGNPAVESEGQRVNVADLFSKATKICFEPGKSVNGTKEN